MRLNAMILERPKIQEDSQHLFSYESIQAQCSTNPPVSKTSKQPGCAEMSSGSHHLADCNWRGILSFQNVPLRVNILEVLNFFFHRSMLDRTPIL